jgi:hypothetical protein
VFGVKFNGSQGLALLLRILKQSPLHEALLSQIGKISNDPDLRLRASVKSIPFRPKWKEGKNPVFSKSFWHVLSIFGDPHDPSVALVPKNAGIALSLGNQFLEMNLLDHQIVISEPTHLYGRRMDSFLPVEDRLLLLGLGRFGLGNWEKIQSYMLPTRTAKQLYNRYKNLTSRCAPMNPIKDFLAEAMKPLSRAEEELLLQGIRTYGDDWVSISRRFLPHRPPSVLRRLGLKRRAVKSRAILDLDFPTEDEEDSDYREA